MASLKQELKQILVRRQHRIYERDSHSDIEDVIDWESVRKCTKDNVKMSE